MKVAVIDLETTGLLMHPRAKPELQPRCIEFGGVVIDKNGTQLRSLSRLINPGCKLDPVITKITGITDEDLRDQPPFAEVAGDIADLLGDCDVIIAHNLPFDSGVLGLEFDRLGFDLWLPPIKLCTVQENVPRYGYRVKLKDLYSDVTDNHWVQTHRALDDCTRLADVVIAAGYLEDLK